MALSLAGRVRAALPRIALLLALGACRTDTQSAGLDPVAPAAPPVMALSVTEADFAAMTHGVAPMRTVAISNAGGGALGGLGIGTIEYFGDDRGWLTASLTSTTAPATLTLQAAAGNLTPGTYYATVSLVATGAANSPRSIAVSFRVDAAALGPIIGLSAVSASLSAVTGSVGSAQQVLILPASDAPLTGLAISDVTYDPSASGWLQASLQETSAPTVLVLTPDGHGLGVGTYVAIVTISAPGAINSPRTIRVVLNVTAAPVPPILRLSTTAIAASGSTASPPASQTVAITNEGGGTIEGLVAGPVSYGPGASGWLGTSLSSSAAPAMLILTPSVSGLAPGTYGATVPVRAATSGIASQSVTVTLTVLAAPIPPAIGLASSSTSFVALVGGSAPVPATIAVSNAGGGTLSGLAVGTIGYGAGGSGWLSATLSSSNAPATLTLSVAPGSLAAGSYTASVPVTSAGASNSPQSVSVTLTVSTVPVPPAIALSPSNLSFSATAGSTSPAAKMVTVSNAGGGTLSGLGVGSITYGAGATGWLAASLNITTAPATLTVTPTLGALAAGTYTATVPVTSTGASNSPQSVSVTFTVAAAAVPPAIALSPSSLSFSATAGSTSPAAKVVTVSNAGGGTLSGLAVGTITYGAGASGWLGASLNTTTAPATLTVTPALGALAPGTYTATVPVTAVGASNSPQNVSVTFTVAAALPPAIALSPTSLSFSATAGGSSPAAKTSSVSNSGGGTLSGLAVGSITYGAGATGWVAASLNTTTAPATLTVTPTLGALAAGTYTATVPVTAVGASNSPQNVAVTFTVASAVTQVSFKNDIYPTFQANCLSSGCHVPGQQKPDLSSVSAAYTNLVTATTTYVTPGDSTKGLLLGVLQNTTGPLMPPTGKLSSAFITKVKAWIAQGAKNN